MDEASTLYAAQRPLYVDLASKLRELLGELLTQENTDFHTIEQRAKALTSLTEKLTRPSKAYHNGPC